MQAINIYVINMQNIYDQNLQKRFKFYTICTITNTHAIQYIYYLFLNQQVLNKMQNISITLTSGKEILETQNHPSIYIHKQNLEKIISDNYGLKEGSYNLTYIDPEGDQIMANVEDDFQIIRATFGLDDHVEFKIEIISQTPPIGELIQQEPFDQQEVIKSAIKMSLSFEKDQQESHKSKLKSQYEEKVQEEKTLIQPKPQKNIEEEKRIRDKFEEKARLEFEKKQSRIKQKQNEALKQQMSESDLETERKLEEKRISFQKRIEREKKIAEENLFMKKQKQQREEKQRNEKQFAQRIASNEAKKKAEERERKVLEELLIYKQMLETERIAQEEVKRKEIEERKIQERQAAMKIQQEQIRRIELEEQNRLKRQFEEQQKRQREEERKLQAMRAVMLQEKLRREAQLQLEEENRRKRQIEEQQLRQREQERKFQEMREAILKEKEMRDLKELQLIAQRDEARLERQLQEKRRKEQQQELERQKIQFQRKQKEESELLLQRLIQQEEELREKQRAAFEEEQIQQLQHQEQMMKSVQLQEDQEEKFLSGLCLNKIEQLQLSQKEFCAEDEEQLLKQFEDRIQNQCIAQADHSISDIQNYEEYQRERATVEENRTQLMNQIRNLQKHQDLEIIQAIQVKKVKKQKKVIEKNKKNVKNTKKEVQIESEDEKIFSKKELEFLINQIVDKKLQNYVKKEKSSNNLIQKKEYKSLESKSLIKMDSANVCIYCNSEIQVPYYIDLASNMKICNKCEQNQMSSSQFLLKVKSLNEVPPKYVNIIPIYENQLEKSEENDNLIEVFTELKLVLAKKVKAKFDSSIKEIKQMNKNCKIEKKKKMLKVINEQNSEK